MRLPAIKALRLFTGLLLAAAMGCGGGGSSTPQVVQVNLVPASLSLNAGDVQPVTAGAVGPGNSTPTLTQADFTYSSSNPSVATVSPTGQVCGGTWDSNFIVCNGKNAAGQAVAGQANITATAFGVSSSAAVVFVHPKVTSVTVSSVTGCTSTGKTQQFTAQVFSGTTDITNLVGPVTFGTVDSNIAASDPNGLVTARAPGLTGVFASTSGVSSAAANFRTCMPVSLKLHIPNTTVTTVTLASGQTPAANQAVEVDMTDENGVTTQTAPTNFFTNNPLVAQLGVSLFTAGTPGGSGIVAGCVPPTCGAGINQPVYSNLFSMNVTGTSPTTTVYATSSFTPPAGTSPTIVPIDTSKNTLGTAITLPGVPNSLVFAGNGSTAFLGTNAGLVLLDPIAGTATLVSDKALGQVLAVSSDGNTAIVSNAANDPSTGNPIEPDPLKQRVFVFNRSGALLTLVTPGAVDAAFDIDSFKAYVAANNGNVYVISPSLTLRTLALGGSSTSVANLASAAFDFVANSAGLQVIAVCDNSQQAAAPTTGTPQIVRPVLNADKLVVVSSSTTLNTTGLDIETVTVGDPPTGFCPPTVSATNSFTDFGLGPITARRLLVDSFGKRAAVLPVGINKILTAPVAGGAPVNIPLAGAATEAFTGGMTLDGTSLWVGVGGTNSVDKIDLTTNTDAVQIATTFKKSDGSAAPPDLVAVRPQ